MSLCLLRTRGNSQVLLLGAACRCFLPKSFLRRYRIYTERRLTVARGSNQSFHIHNAPTHLLTVCVSDQSLFTARIFLTHTASLRHTTFFARLPLGGFETTEGSVTTANPMQDRCNSLNQTAMAEILASDSHRRGPR
jgi:hypothetical protein